MIDQLKALIIGRGEQAKTILQEEAFIESVKTIRQRYIDESFSTKLGQADKREECYRAVRILDEIVGELQTCVSNALYEQNKP